jgi:hypothetical protein
MTTKSRSEPVNCGVQRWTIDAPSSDQYEKDDEGAWVEWDDVQILLWQLERVRGRARLWKYLAKRGRIGAHHWYQMFLAQGEATDALRVAAPPAPMVPLPGCPGVTVTPGLLEANLMVVKRAQADQAVLDACKALRVSRNADGDPMLLAGSWGRVLEAVLERQAAEEPPCEHLTVADTCPAVCAKCGAEVP